MDNKRLNKLPTRSTAVQNAIAKRQTFTTHGAMRGEVGEVSTVGQLDRKWRASVARATYVVYSYETPIAWVDRETNTWVIPSDKYSVTTTRHQHTARMGASYSDLETYAANEYGASTEAPKVPDYLNHTEG